MSDVGPACFIWLNVFHRFTVVQSVTHPVTCNVCQRTNFNGFRYKCQKCRKYQLCQDCFWRGRVSHSHQLTHQMKEYTSYVGIFLFCLTFSLSFFFYFYFLYFLYRNQLPNSFQIHLKSRFSASQANKLKDNNNSSSNSNLTNNSSIFLNILLTINV